MKRKCKPLAQNSLELRNLTKHPMPPPTTSFVDRKRKATLKRIKIDNPE